MFSLTRIVILSGLIAVAFCAQASAQVIAQFPNPHAAKCSDFHHDHSAHSWIPKGVMQVTSTQGTASIGPQDSFSAGKLVEGFDLGRWLDGECQK
jgi:hypothetical protein